jgi:hypothetical protein
MHASYGFLFYRFEHDKIVAFQSIPLAADCPFRHPWCSTYEMNCAKNVYHFNCLVTQKSS